MTGPTSRSPSRPPRPPAVDLADWRDLPAVQRNGRLFEWLCDDACRAELYRAIRSDRTLDGMLAFPSRAIADPEDSRLRPRPPWDQPPPSGHVDVHLVVDRERIVQILVNDGDRFSNAPYAALGTGNFMLSLDRPTAGDDLHARQVRAFGDAFPHDLQQIRSLCRYAVEAAAVGSLGNARFDLAAFAEQAALRFCGALYGYALRDHVLIDSAMRAAYRGMSYRMFARHFVSDPTVMVEAQRGMALLLARTSALIEEYRQGHPGKPEQLEPPPGHPDALTPAVLARLAQHAGTLNGEELAVLAVGSMAGIVGNVQAAACIAIEAFFAAEDRLAVAAGLAWAASASDTDPDALAAAKKLDAMIAEACRLNPPAPFLPRVVVDANGTGLAGVEARDELILGVGGGTRAAGEEFRTPPPPGEDPLIFGWRSPGSEPAGLHQCIGDYLARPLVSALVRTVLVLPGLAEAIDPVDGQPIGLRKTWGFRCESYRLSYQRDKRLMQQSLNVSMRIRTPVAENAAKLRQTIAAAAPAIERALRDSRHVHFAWFELIDNDSRLVLHTVYDGDFNAYIQHFALRVSELFDSLMIYLEDAPPLPVAQFPNEFIETIRRFDQKPVAGYFFSAYPKTDAAAIVREARQRKAKRHSTGGGGA